MVQEEVICGITEKILGFHYVQILLENRDVVQLVERCSPKANVAGSSPVIPAKYLRNNKGLG